MSSELAPDMLLFTAAIWASVLSALVHQKDIDAAGRYLSGRKPWLSPWRFPTSWRPLLILPGVSVGLAGTVYLIAGPAREEADIWFLVLVVWFVLFKYVITADDWKGLRKVMGRRWRMVWVTAIAAAVFVAGGVLMVESYNEVAKRHNLVVS